MYSEKSINEYLKALSSKAPIPGGGSAAALAGALGAALLSKVANFTIGKDKYKEVEQEIDDILRRSTELCASLEKLCSQDAQAYKKLSDAFKLPKDTSKERKVKIQEALKEAVAVPLDICKNVYGAVKLCVPLAQKGNANLITDVGVAMDMFNCAFHCALLNVEINLKKINKDEQFILSVREVLEPMEKELTAISQEVKTEVEKHLRKE